MPDCTRFRQADLNEAGLPRTLSRARGKRHRRFDNRSLAERSVSAYDEEIVRLASWLDRCTSNFTVILSLSTTSKQKSTEIP